MQQKQLRLALTNLALFHAAAFTFSAQKEALCVMFKPMAVPSVNVSIILLLSQKFPFKRRSSNENATYNWQQQEHILSAILLLPEFHCSRELISIVSRSRPLPASRPVGHVIKIQCFLWAAIRRRKEQYYFAFLRSSSIMVDYIKSFGREQSRQHKQSAVLRTLDVQSLNFCLKGKT